jgi:hypothetical protein
MDVATILSRLPGRNSSPGDAGAAVVCG